MLESHSIWLNELTEGFPEIPNLHVAMMEIKTLHFGKPEWMTINHSKSRYGKVAQQVSYQQRF
jgi:hypothetical protein